MYDSAGAFRKYSAQSLRTQRAGEPNPYFLLPTPWSLIFQSLFPNPSLSLYPKVGWSVIHQRLDSRLELIRHAGSHSLIGSGVQIKSDVKKY